MDNILEQLWEIYNKYEMWHDFRLNKKDFKDVKNKLINDGNLYYEIMDEKIISYCEVWKISYEQWGKITCRYILSPLDNDLVNGNIAYIANLWIKEDYKKTLLVNRMQRKFISLYKDCEYVALHRKHGVPFRTYPMKRVAKLYQGV